MSGPGDYYSDDDADFLDGMDGNVCQGCGEEVESLNESSQCYECWAAENGEG
ncbi:MAG: hypothetical protein Q7T70_02390 [Polaromonas sp.]|nr:hypothetical protein [Polaromonas sp.]